MQAKCQLRAPLPKSELLDMPHAIQVIYTGVGMNNKILNYWASWSVHRKHPMCGKWRELYQIKNSHSKRKKKSCSYWYTFNLPQGYLQLPSRRPLQTDILGPNLDGSQEYLHPIDSRNNKTPVLLLVLLEMALTESLPTNAAASGGHSTQPSLYWDQEKST